MAWIAALIGAAATYYGSQQQKKASGKVTEQQNRLYGIQADTAEKLQPYALDFYRKSNDAIDPALAYYRALASGDSSKTYAALAPQLSAIGQKYRSVFNASSELNQRGGLSSSYAAELPFQAANEKQALVSNARSNAYGNLSGLFGQLANAGAGAAGGSVSAAGRAGDTFNNAWGMMLANSKNQADAYGKIGEQLWTAWQKYHEGGG